MYCSGLVEPEALSDIPLYASVGVLIYGGGHQTTSLLKGCWDYLNGWA